MLRWRRERRGEKKKESCKFAASFNIRTKELCERNK